MLLGQYNIYRCIEGCTLILPIQSSVMISAVSSERIRNEDVIRGKLEQCSTVRQKTGWLLHNLNPKGGVLLQVQEPSGGYCRPGAICFAQKQAKRISASAFYLAKLTQDRNRCIYSWLQEDLETCGYVEIKDVFLSL